MNWPKARHTTRNTVYTPTGVNRKCVVESIYTVSGKESTVFYAYRKCCIGLP